MIRRAFWLSVGAAAGITSYRRATAVGRAISVRVAGDRSSAAPGPFWPPQPNRNGQRPASGPPPATVEAADRPPALSRPAASPQPRPSAQPRPFQRPRPSAQPRPHPQWSTARAAWRTSRAAWRTQKAAIAQVRAAGRFARDVREGMDLYMNRRDGEPGPNLASAPGATRGTRNRWHQRPPARPH